MGWNGHHPAVQLQTPSTPASRGDPPALQPNLCPDGSPDLPLQSWGLGEGDEH